MGEQDVPRGGRSTARRFAGALAVAAIAAGGVVYSLGALQGNPASGTDRVAQTVAASPPAPTPQTASPSLSPSASAVRGLAAPLLVPSAKWELVADDLANTGRVDLNRAAQIDGHGELSRTGLRQLGFVVGQSRSWQSGSAALLVLNYTFKTERGAAGFVTYGRRARDGDPAFTQLPVPRVPGAAGYQRRTGETTDIVIFARGRSAFVMGIQGGGSPEDLASLARQQYAAAG